MAADNFLRNPGGSFLLRTDAIDEGLLEVTGHDVFRQPPMYAITDRGRAYVETLKAIPLPTLRQSWVTKFPTLSSHPVTL